MRDPVLSVQEEAPGSEHYRPVRLETRRGEVACRFYAAPAARGAAVWVGGAGGGWDTPARGLYPRLCEELVGEGIASLRVRFRKAQALEEAAFDVRTGIAYLQRKGIGGLALIGHSLGGAAVIRAAASAVAVRTVVALATQSYGAGPASGLAPRCSLLFLHGTADPVLPPRCSRHVYDLAQEPKRLVLYPGAGHGLDEAAEEVHQVVRDWIVAQLDHAAQKTP